MNHWRAVCRQTCKHGSAGDGWKRTRCAPRQPSTRLLKREIENPILHDLKLKIDPGSKTTGVAIVNQESGEVVFAAEIEHRGQTIKSRLDARRVIRRGRRARKTRYRKPRFDNRRRPEG
jgi:hypothetical protein